MSNETSYPKDKINILFLENISEKAVQLFRQNGYTNVEKLAGALSESELIEKIKDVHLLGIRSKTTITPAVLEAAKKLQAIGCFCIGVNQVNLKAATRSGVTVFNAPYSNTRSVAELVVGASIMLIRKILDKNNAAHKGTWQKEAKGSFELRGKTMGLVGYGNIGSQVSVLAEAFGMKVRYYDIESKLPLGNAASFDSLEELVSKSDIVSLHVPDTNKTKNMVNEELLAQFNVLLTPHIGGSTEEAQMNIGEDVSNKLFNFLESGITNGSHTVPGIALPPIEGTHRILHIHKNVPGVLSSINTLMSNNHINISGQYLKTNEEIGYVVLDVDSEISEIALELLREVKETIKVRVLY